MPPQFDAEAPPDTDASKTAARPQTGLIALLIFIGKWAVAGLVFAAVLLWIHPELRNAAVHREHSGEHPVLAKPSGTAARNEPQQPELATGLRSGNQPHERSDDPASATSYARTVARSAPSVVNIYTARVVTEPVRPPVSELYERLFGRQPPALRQRVEASLGSGVIVDARGHVVTNHHVIADAQQIRLQLADGRIAEPKLVGDDPDTDLALLKIDLKHLPVMQLGRSDTLHVGDIVLAIGNPYGLSQTVTHGIVSATGRDQLGLSPFESFIQTDAAINAGNSGGALVNLEGELIGINTAVLSPATGVEGIGFAIPVDMVRGVVEELIKHGRVLRGWLGVNTQSVSKERAAQLGLAVAEGAELVEITPDSPAAHAGLKVGDVITTLDGHHVHDAREAMMRVAGLKPGSVLHIQGRGGDGPLDVHVAIAERH